MTETEQAIKEALQKLAIRVGHCEYQSQEDKRRAIITAAVERACEQRERQLAERIDPIASQAATAIRQEIGEALCFNGVQHIDEIEAKIKRHVVIAMQRAALAAGGEG